MSAWHHTLIGKYLGKLSSTFGLQTPDAQAHAAEALPPKPSASSKEENEKTPGPTKEFKLFSISMNVDSTGSHGHLLIAPDGESYEAGFIRSNPGAPQIGQLFQVPVQGGRPHFAALGFTSASKIQDSDPEHVAGEWNKLCTARELVQQFSQELARAKQETDENTAIPDQSQESEHEQEQDHEISR